MDITYVILVILIVKLVQEMEIPQIWIVIHVKLIIYIIHKIVIENMIHIQKHFIYQKAMKLVVAMN